MTPVRIGLLQYVMLYAPSFLFLLSFSGLPLSSRPFSSSSPAFRLCPERFLQLAAVQSHAQSLCKARTEASLWKLFQFQVSLDLEASAV